MKSYRYFLKNAQNKQNMRKIAKSHSLLLKIREISKICTNSEKSFTIMENTQNKQHIEKYQKNWCCNWQIQLQP